MSTMKSFATASVLAVSALASVSAYAGATANIGVTSNYMWRGLSQTGDEAAISGGIDYAHDSGVYVGTWTSSLGSSNGFGNSGQYELDLYGGYTTEISDVKLDVGYIQYMYPIGEGEADFGEVYGKVTFGPVTGTIAYTANKENDAVDTGDLYYGLSAGFEVSEGLTLGGTIGHYDLADDAAEDGSYNHVQIALTKATGDFGDFTFAVDKNDLDDAGKAVWAADNDIDDARVSVSWKKVFDL